MSKIAEVVIEEIVTRRILAVVDDEFDEILSEICLLDNSTPKEIIGYDVLENTVRDVNDTIIIIGDKIGDNMNTDVNSSPLNDSSLIKCRHIYLYAKGAYKKTDSIIEDLRNIYADLWNIKDKSLITIREISNHLLGQVFIQIEKSGPFNMMEFRIFVYSYFNDNLSEDSNEKLILICLEYLRRCCCENDLMLGVPNEKILPIIK